MANDRSDQILQRSAEGGRRIGGCLSILGAFLAGAAVVALIVATTARHPDGWGAALWSALRGGASRFDLSQPAVVEKIQKLQRLETVVYTVDKVVSGSKENPILPDFLAGDRLLMLVHGEVVAGIDFGLLTPADLTIDGHRVEIRLPAPQVFSTRLDSSRTRVYSRQTGLLVPTDPDLESQVRQQAEQQIHDAALADGVLQSAQQNARTTLTSFLQGLGFTQVQFR
jgi:Protein of unknown function (DUF4230)